VLHPTSLPADGSARTPTRSSTGSRRPARAGGRCCRSGRPTTSARRTPRLRVRGLERLPRGARGARRERERRAFRRANAYWIATGSARGRSVADQVRFEREWSALRALRRRARRRLIGDVPIYVAQGSVDQRAHPSLFLRGLVAGRRRTTLGPQGSTGGTRSSTGTPCARGLPLVDRAAAPDAGALRPRPRSTTSAGFAGSGRSRRGRRRPIGTLAARPGRSSSSGREAELGRCR
jgi:hypothetical protein